MSATPKPPSTITVGPYTYSVTVHDALDDGNLRGISDTDEHYIRLNPRLPLDLTRSTLMHEALHCVASAAGIRDEKLDQEAWVTRIEAGLTGLLRDNPELVAYLTAP